MIIGYLVRSFGRTGLIEELSSNTYDLSIEAAMTGAFVIGAFVAVLAVLAFLVIPFSNSK